MKIANIIMAYKNPAQLERMIKSMNHPSLYFYIHVDLKISIEPFLYLKNIDRVTFIADRRLCNWGGYSFVKAVFAALSEVLNDDNEYGFYNLMSAQDYPIKPVAEIVDFYKKNVGKSFISYDPDHKKDWWAHAVIRYEHYHFTDLKFRGRYLLQRFVNYLFPKRTFPLPLKLYGSCISSWWSISAECAQYAVSFIAERPKLEKFMKYTWAADEFLIATILMNSPFQKDIVNDNLRYITWSNESANPLILVSEDFDAIQNSDKFFARKFDIEMNAEILDKIDLELLK